MSEMDVKLGPVTTKMKVAGYNKELPTEEILAAISRRAVFHTGWMPPGVRMISQAGERIQVVIERPPDINLVWWGDREGDPNARLYELAQPWRIIIADFRKEQLLGARLFYSPEPLLRPDQQLFHSNLPNTNCQGYQGNAVGWQCLYLTDGDRFESLHEGIVRVIERSSGAEAYNNRNMDSTDGPRFYKKMNKPRYTWDPITWENRTKEEGVNWTLDEGLWIPVEVASIDEQEAHIAGGFPLTVAAAVEGGYAPYYRQPKDPKLYTTTRQGKYSEELFKEMITQPFNSGGRPFSKASRLLDRDELGEEEPCVLCDTPTTVTRAGHFICTNCKNNHRCCVVCGRELETNKHFQGLKRTCNDCANLQAVK